MKLTKQQKQIGLVVIALFAIALIVQNVHLQSIVGATEVEPGSIQSYTITLNAPYAGSFDYTYGVYTERYCSVALVDSSYNVLQESVFEECQDTWTKTWSATMPSGAFSDYAIVAVMTESKQHYDLASETWILDYENDVIQQEALTLSSRVVTPPMPTSAPLSFSAILDWIWDFLQGVFSFLFG